MSQPQTLGGSIIQEWQQWWHPHPQHHEVKFLANVLKKCQTWMRRTVKVANTMDVIVDVLSKSRLGWDRRWRSYDVDVMEQVQVKRLKVAWFLFLVFKSSEGHKGKKCLSKSRERHVLWVPLGISSGAWWNTQHCTILINRYTQSTFLLLRYP
jgi:hypothetical protein